MENDTKHSLSITWEYYAVFTSTIIKCDAPKLHVPMAQTVSAAINFFWLNMLT